MENEHSSPLILLWVWPLQRLIAKQRCWPARYGKRYSIMYSFSISPTLDDKMWSSVNTSGQNSADLAQGSFIFEV